MKRVIFTPNVDVAIPDIAVYYVLPVAGPVFDCLVEDDWGCDGVLHYDSSAVDVDGNPIPLDEPFIHHYAGWEV